MLARRYKCDTAHANEGCKRRKTEMFGIGAWWHALSEEFPATREDLEVLFGCPGVSYILPRCLMHRNGEPAQ